MPFSFHVGPGIYWHPRRSRRRRRRRPKTPTWLAILGTAGVIMATVLIESIVRMAQDPVRYYIGHMILALIWFLIIDGIWLAVLVERGRSRSNAPHRTPLHPGREERPSPEGKGQAQYSDRR